MRHGVTRRAGSSRPTKNKGEMGSPRGLPRGERKNSETAMVPLRSIGTSEVVRDSDEAAHTGKYI